MELRRHYIGEESIGTIYFGGGTPSLLSEDELRQMLDHIQTGFRVDPAAEITLEANPDDITLPGKLKEWKNAGINRLSIGVQSFFEEDLRWMNRVHNAGQALSAIAMAQDQGLDNISIDLIYGTPGLSDLRWEQNVEKAVRLGIPHLSCYALTVEPKTALDKMIRQHKKEDVSTDDQARQFLLLMDWLSSAGYEHYEISNFALPGHRSRHNSSYWQGKPYLGLGPSAHSFDGIAERQWNIANNAIYIDTLLGTGPSSPDRAPLYEKEVLTPTQQLNEYIMISLRTMEGCDLQQVSARFGEPAATALYRRAEPHIRQATLMTVPGQSLPTLVLTQAGKLLADGIAADLFE